MEIIQGGQEKYNNALQRKMKHFKLLYTLYVRVHIIYVYTHTHTHRDTHTHIHNKTHTLQSSIKYLDILNHKFVLFPFHPRNKLRLGYVHSTLIYHLLYKYDYFFLKKNSSSFEGRVLE